MKRIQILLAVTLLAAPAAFGQVRTWLDGGLAGDDINPCSRLAPCKTFAGAYSKTSGGGEIDVAEAGGFGQIIIGKSLTLDGLGQKAAISTGSTGITINAPGAVVVIRNLDLNGFGSGSRGILISDAASVTIENVKIQGHTAEGIRDARVTAGELFVRDVEINGGTYGVLVTGGTATSAVLENVSVRNATVAGARASTGNARIHIIESTFTGNGTGALADTAEMFIERSAFSYNTTGVDASMASTVRLSECVITRNGTGVSITGLMESFGNNRIRGNTSGNGAGLSGVLDQ